jgi:hypothetical protein
MKKTFTAKQKKKLNNKWTKYESLKTMILMRNLPTEEYEAEIKALTKKIGV